MSKKQKKRHCGAVVSLLNPVAAQISDLRLEESTKSNYSGKIRRIVLFVKEKDPAGILEDELLVPMKMGWYAI